jgi:E3 ubiquitin-protein ligase HERC2
MSIANAATASDARAAVAAAESLSMDSKQHVAPSGQVYSWGSGDFGRLGHGSSLPHTSASLIEILRDKNIRKVECGERHSCALTADGALYSWGYGGDGQLGHGDFQVQTLPALITGLRSKHIIDVVCGEKHTVALTSGGEVYCWGDGARGQLGLGGNRKQPSPERVMELQGRMVLKISAGAYHTACILQNHDVYSWGAGAAGRLGVGHEQDALVPTLVKSLEGKNIHTIKCYAEHTMAMTAASDPSSDSIFESESQARLLQTVKELEVRHGDGGW